LHEFCGLPTKTTYIGIVAQDVQSVAPYCISSAPGVLKESEKGDFPAAVFFRKDTIHTGQIDQGTGQPIHTQVNTYKADILQYNPDGLFYAMINAIKELDAENQALKTELNAIRSRLTALENK